MKTFTIADIRALNPCYSPKRYLAENWQGNALDILKHADISAKDKLWVVLRKDILSDKILRLFAVSCARSMQHLLKDERSINAINIAERYAFGTATKEELSAARAAAYSATTNAAYAATYAADADDARTQHIVELIKIINTK